VVFLLRFACTNPKAQYEIYGLEMICIDLLEQDPDWSLNQEEKYKIMQEWIVGEKEISGEDFPYDPNTGRTENVKFLNWGKYLLLSKVKGEVSAWEQEIVDEEREKMQLEEDQEGNAS